MYSSILPFPLLYSLFCVPFGSAQGRPYFLFLITSFQIQTNYIFAKPTEKYRHATTTQQ
jgi:hypothetical protein